MEHLTIFSKKETYKKVQLAFHQGIKDIDEKIKIIENWQSNLLSGKFLQAKEEELQSLFLFRIFGDVLGYEYQNPNEWNLTIEQKTKFDSTKSDGAIGFFKIINQKETQNDVRAIIELKNARTSLDKPQNRKDFKGTPVEQAFMYANKTGGKCKWVIVSNFLEIRLYQSNDINKYEKFDLFSISEITEFKRFYYLLSKEQFIQPSIPSVIDHFLQNRLENEKKVGQEFYAYYKFIREQFCYHLKTYNKEIDFLKLLEYAQTIIDRIVFISVIKDYDLISYDVFKQLKNIAESSWEKDGMELWRQLQKLFRAMNEGFPPRIHQFNGGLFKENPAINELKIKDTFLNKLLRLTNYDFESDLSINILGHIFEQSISDIEKLKEDIAENRLTENEEEKQDIRPEELVIQKGKRKEDGIFYTPENITGYIIAKSIGAWLERKKDEIGINQIQETAIEENEKQKQTELWKQYINVLKNIKILDPACGSGAFLTQAFDYLYNEWRIVITEINKLNNILPTIKKTGTLILENSNGDFEDWKIRKQIVSNNLFGVDINKESVEITKLGLWIKTANKNDSLASLDTNIKFGNSLINNHITKHPFDWNTEFNEIIKNGGFDVIVGNPPYVRQETINKEEKKYLIENYEVGNTGADLYVYFYEKALKLLKNNGLLGYITPNKWFKTKYGTNLRTFLKQFSINQIIDFFEIKVFPDVATDTQIILIENTRQNKPFKYIPLINLIDFTNIDNKQVNTITVNPKDFNGSEWIFAPTDEYKILKRMFKKSISLIDYTNNGIEYGLKTGLNKAFIIDKATKEQIIKEDPKSAELIKPYAVPVCIKKYHIEKATDYFFLNTGYDIEIDKNNYFGIYNHLRKFDKELEKRLDKGKKRYNLRACSYYEKFVQPKIIYIRTAINHNFFFDTDGYYVNDSCYIISDADKFLSLFLNSSMFNFYKRLNFVAYGNPEKRGRSKLDYNKMIDVPIPLITDEQKLEFEQLHDKITQLYSDLYKRKEGFTDIVSGRLNIGKISTKLDNWYDLEWKDFDKELTKAKIKIPTKELREWRDFFVNEKQQITTIVNQINEIEAQIDDKVYQLYNITELEKNIIRKS